MTTEPRSLPPAGWYVDPWRLAPGRWWDGSAWAGETTGWLRQILLPPVSTDGRCRYVAFEGHETAPTPAELWKRWPAEPRHVRRWCGIHNWPLISAVVVVIVLALFGSVMGVALAVLAGMWLFVVRSLLGWGDKTPLALVPRGLVGVGGVVSPRWESSPSAVSGTDCVWWEAVLESRAGRRGHWSRAWNLMSLGVDFNLGDEDGRLWVHASQLRKVRRCAVELVHEEFEHAGRSYRLIERGLCTGADVVGIGLVISTTSGEPALSDDLEIGSPRALGVELSLKLLPREVAERRRTEIDRALIVTAVACGLGLLTAFWPGLLDLREFEKAPIWELWLIRSILLVMFVAPLAVVWSILPALRAQQMRSELAASYWLVRSRCELCWNALADLERTQPEFAAPGVMGADAGVAAGELPDPTQVKETSRRIEEMDARWGRLEQAGPGTAAGRDAAALARLERYLSARRMLELAIGHYHQAVAEAESAKARGGRAAKKLEAQIPVLPSPMPRSTKWA